MPAPRFENSQVAAIGPRVTWQQVAETLVAIDAASCVGDPLDETSNALAELLGIMAFNKSDDIAWVELNDLQRAALRHFHERDLTAPLPI